MLSIGLWLWYINITITILDIIHRIVFYLKLDISETGFCLCLQVEHTQLSPIEEGSVVYFKIVVCMELGSQQHSIFIITTLADNVRQYKNHKVFEPSRLENLKNQ
jgi:hypothetical protein